MNIFITGTSSGIGFGLAKHYLEADHNVYGISRRHNEQLEQYLNFKFLSQDLSSLKEVSGNISRFLEDVEVLDLVILNAGVLSEIKDMKDTSLEEIKKVMDINVWANKVIIDTLFETVDRIDQVVGISSGASVSGSRGWNAYSLSKATLNMLMDLYAKEHQDTHFTALAPGIIDTAMQDYIYSLEEEEKFPVLKFLKGLKGTSEMPPAGEAANHLAEIIPHLREFESGSYQDVREMEA